MTLAALSRAGPTPQLSFSPSFCRTSRLSAAYPHSLHAGGAVQHSRLRCIARAGAKCGSAYAGERLQREHASPLAAPPAQHAQAAAALLGRHITRFRLSGSGATGRRDEVTPS